MERLFGTLLPLRGWPIWARYVATALIVSAGLGVRLLVDAAPNEHPFVFFIPPIIVTAVFFDRGNGVFAAVLSTLLAVYFFVEPVSRFAVANPQDLIATVVFLCVAIAMAVLIEGLHTAYAETHRAHSELGDLHKRLQNAVRERDVLLSELSHRVKNDMAILSATLHLQMREVDDSAAKNALASAADRINVLSRVHSRLRRTQGDIDVDSREFIDDLCDDLRTSLVAMRPISVAVNAESHPLSMNRAVPVGLILNELLTNALKYAFPGERGGTVTVSFARGGDLFELRVSDNGVGPDGEAKTGVGGRVVRALAAQLGGSLDNVDRVPGLEVVVRFPAAE